MEQDLEQLSTDLESDPTLEDWSGFSPEHQLGDTKALAVTEQLEEMFTGSQGADSDLYHGPGGPDFTQVEDYLKTLKEADSGVADGGTTEEAIGAEAADLAEAAGIVVPSSFGLVAGLVPLTGVLVYEDVTTGTNEIFSRLFSPNQDLSQIESEGGVGAEAMRWVRFKPGCSSEHTFIDCLRSELYSQDGESAARVSEQLAEAHFSERAQYDPESFTEPPLAVSHPVYVMQVEEGGLWYDGSTACSLAGDNPAGLTESWSYVSCERSEATQISGWPLNLRHVASQTTTSLHPNAMGHLGSCGCNEQYIWGVTAVRSPSRFHTGLPHAHSKSFGEKLEHEGDIVRHSTGHTTGPGELPGVVKNEVIKEKEGGSKRFNQWVEHYTGGGTAPSEPQPETEESPPVPGKAEGESPPVPGLTEVPDCFLSFHTGTECASLLGESGFSSVEIDTRTWEHADVGQPAEATLSVTPSTGSRVETSTKIQVEQNPAPAGMPVEVPQIHKGTETGEQYKERIETEGWTKVEVRTLPETSIDPSLGPNQASYTVPSPDTAVDPCQCTDVVVETNPPDAPVPSEGGGGLSVPSPPGFHFPKIKALCRNFPFGVPCWMVEEISNWTVASEAPTWNIPITSPHFGNLTTLHLDFSVMEPAMEILRPAFVFVFSIGMVFAFFRFAIGSAPGAGGSED